MIINFKTGSSGWANYVEFGTREKPREKEKIEVIDGDLKQAEYIASQNKFSGEYYKVLISAEKKITNEEMKLIYKDVKKEIFHGLNEDEYYAAAIIHQDTEKTHIHMNIPKQNLLTGQHLQLYMQGIDTKRIEAIQDNVAIKYGLKTIAETKQTIQEPRELIFVKERETRNQEPFIFTLSNKKAKAHAENQVKKLVQDNLENLYSLDDVKNLIHEQTNLKVVNTGYEQKKKFYYFTVQDPEDKKTRVKGELFSEEFFKQKKPKQKEQLNSNVKSYTDLERELEAKRVKANLRRENEKRYKVCQKLFKNGRARALAEQQKIYRQGKINEYTREQRAVARKLHQPSGREIQSDIREAKNIHNLPKMSYLSLVHNRKRSDTEMLLSKNEQPNDRRIHNPSRSSKPLQPTRARDIETTPRERENSRGELNDRDRNITQTSPRRSNTTTNKRGRQQSPTLAKSALQIQQERIRTTQKVRQTRRRILNEYENACKREQTIKRKFAATINNLTRAARQLTKTIRQIGEKIKEIFKLQKAQAPKITVQEWAKFTEENAKKFQKAKNQQKLS